MCYAKNVSNDTFYFINSTFKSQSISSGLHPRTTTIIVIVQDVNDDSIGERNFWLSNGFHCNLHQKIILIV
jgi:hypothetical protein